MEPQIGKCINMVSHQFRHTLDGIDNGYDLSNVAIMVIGHLAHEEAVYQSDFEDILHIRRSSISSILSNLESKGYIERITDAIDTRRKRVVLTDLGKKVAQDTYNNTIVRVENAIGTCLNEEERVNLIQSLKKVYDTLDKIQKEGFDD